MGRRGADSKCGRVETRPETAADRTGRKGGGGGGVKVQPEVMAAAAGGKDGGAYDAACAVDCGRVGVQCAVSVAIDEGQGGVRGLTMDGSGSLSKGVAAPDEVLPPDEDLRENFQKHFSAAGKSGDIAMLSRLITVNADDISRYQIVIYSLFTLANVDGDPRPEALSAISALLLQEYSSVDGWFLDKYSVEPIDLYDGSCRGDNYEQHHSEAADLAELKKYLISFITARMEHFMSDPVALFFILSTIKDNLMKLSLAEAHLSNSGITRPCLEKLKVLRAYYYLALLTIQASEVNIRKNCAAYLMELIGSITDTDTLRVLASCDLPIAKKAQAKLDEIEADGSARGEIAAVGRGKADDGTGRKGERL